MRARSSAGPGSDTRRAGTCLNIRRRRRTAGIQAFNRATVHPRDVCFAMNRLFADTGAERAASTAGAAPGLRHVRAIQGVLAKLATGASVSHVLAPSTRLRLGPPLRSGCLRGDATAGARHFCPSSRRAPTTKERTMPHAIVNLKHQPDAVRNGAVRIDRRTEVGERIRHRARWNPRRGHRALPRRALATHSRGRGLARRARGSRLPQTRVSLPPEAVSRRGARPRRRLGRLGPRRPRRRVTRGSGERRTTEGRERRTHRQRPRRTP